MKNHTVGQKVGLSPTMAGYIVSGILLTLLWGSEGFAQIRSYPALEYYSTGYDALHYERKNAIFTDLQTTLLDGQKKSSDTNITFDRSLIADVRVGYNRVINAKFGARFIAAATGGIRKEHTDFAPISATEEDGYLIKPSLDFTMVTGSGIELSAGIKYVYMPEYFGRKETPTVISNFRFAEYSLRQPRFSIVKRGGFGQGGFFFHSGVEANRDVEISLEDNSEPSKFSKQAIRLPTTVGIMVRIGSSGTQWYAEFQGVQAGEGGERKDGSNKTVLEDFNILKIGYAKALGGLNLDTMLTHKTLSYASSEDTRMDLVPMTALHIRAKAGSKDSFVYAGIVYLYASDLQSEEEFNQEFRINGYGASAGFRIGM